MASSTSSPHLTIATVLRSGGDFEIEHVRRLRVQVDRYLTVPHMFMCFTDKPTRTAMEAVCATTRLKTDWPGWWAKLEMFRYDFGPTVYLDLDTTIRGCIDWIADLPAEFTMLRDWLVPGYFGSGLMAWTGAQPDIPEGFSLAEIPRWQSFPRYGDQGWIQHKRPEARIVQDLHPRRVVSRKRSTPEERREASIISYHGKPRPWDDDEDR